MNSSRAGAAVAGIAILAALIVVDAAHADPAPTVQWRRFLGTAELDLGRGAATDSAGDIIVGGTTFGSIGEANEGDYDAFVVKYSPEGMVKWRRQPSSAREDSLNGLATDFADNVLAVGYTRGALAGPHQGYYDGFVVKYAADGTEQWRRQFGTAGYEVAEAVATDAAGNIIVAGRTGDAALVIKYAPDGAEQWRRLLDSTEYDHALGVATDAAGTIVVVGLTGGSLAGPLKGLYDTFVAKYSADGTPQWIEQPGKPGEDAGRAVAIDSVGRIFVAGNHAGPTSGGSGFLAAFSDAGVELWRRHRGGDYFDGIWGVAIDPEGNVVVGGSAFREQFAASYTPLGAPQWTRKLPTFFDYKLTPAIGPAGALAIVGTVSRNNRSFDAFLVKYVLP
jgi:hypothetical protein